MRGKCHRKRNSGLSNLAERVRASDCQAANHRDCVRGQKHKRLKRTLFNWTREDKLREFANNLMQKMCKLIVYFCFVRSFEKRFFEDFDAEDKLIDFVCMCVCVRVCVC